MDQMALQGRLEIKGPTGVLAGRAIEASVAREDVQAVQGHRGYQTRLPFTFQDWTLP